VIDAHRRTGRLDGRCLCGAVSIRVDGAHVAAIGVCHCSMCQRWNGVLHGSFDAAPEAVDVEGAVTRYPATAFSERAFCPACGSHLWMRDTTEDGAAYELMPGLFPAARDFPLISEIYIDRAPVYIPLSGDHRRATRAEYEATHPHIEGDLP
jgi:hypothetical protein